MGQSKTLVQPPRRPMDGSLENRTRFSREILTRIRKLCGEDFIVGMAVNDEPEVDTNGL